jgi:hypothetical protein
MVLLSKTLPEAVSTLTGGWSGWAQITNGHA